MTELSKYSILFTPEENEPVTGIIQFIHDFGEHHGRYRDFAHFLTGYGYVVVTGDLRGHGNNVSRTTELGFFGDNALSRLVGDIHDNRLYLRERFPDVPYMIIGQGIGALIAVSYFKKYDNFVDGLFLLGMPAKKKTRLPLALLLKGMIALKGEYHRSRLMYSILYGPMSKPFSNESSVYAWLTSDSDELKLYENDNKCGFIPTLNGFTTMLELYEAVYSKGSWIHKKTKCPIRLFAGSSDPFVISKNNLARTAHLFSDNGYANTAYISYPGQRHDLLHDVDNDNIIDDLLKEIESAVEEAHKEPVKEEPSHIILEDFIDPEIEKPLVKEEKINLEDFINAAAKKDAEKLSKETGSIFSNDSEERSKVEMLDYHDIESFDIDLESIISTVKDDPIDYEPAPGLNISPEEETEADSDEDEENYEDDESGEYESADDDSEDDDSEENGSGNPQDLNDDFLESLINH